MAHFERLASLAAYKVENTPCPIRLSSNECPIHPSDATLRKIADAVGGAAINIYPDPEARNLKAVLARWYAVNPENLILGNGSSELIALLVSTIGRPEAPVAYPAPTFSLYGIASDAIGRPKLEFPLGLGYRFDEAIAEKIISARPGLVFLSTPNNPTGNVFDPALIMRIADAGIFTVVDEAYVDFSSSRNLIGESLQHDNLVVMRTLSKIGLAGLRIGAVIGRPDVVAALDKARLSFNLSVPSQIIATIFLTEEANSIRRQIAAVILERDRVAHALQKYPGIRVFPSQANFLLVRVPEAQGLRDALVRRGILVRNMSTMQHLAGCLRITIGKSNENTAFLAALQTIWGR